MPTIFHNIPFKSDLHCIFHCKCHEIYAKITRNAFFQWPIHEQQHIPTEPLLQCSIKPIPNNYREFDTLHRLSEFK